MSSVLTKHTTKGLKIRLPYRSMILALTDTERHVRYDEVGVLVAEPKNEQKKVVYEFFLVPLGDEVKGAYVGTLPDGQHVFYRTET